MTMTRLEDIEYDKWIKVVGEDGLEVKRFYPTLYCHCGNQIKPKLINRGPRKGRWEHTSDFRPRETCSIDCATAKRIAGRGQKPILKPVKKPAGLDAVINRFLFAGPTRLAG